MSPQPSQNQQRGQRGDSSPFVTPDPYAQDAALAAALSVPSQAADANQAVQNGSSASMARMTSQPPQTGSEDVWVTVPVDKVSVAKGKGTVTPLYAPGDGYQGGRQAKPQTPPAGTLIPPATTTGTRGASQNGSQ